MVVCLLNHILDMFYLFHLADIEYTAANFIYWNKLRLAEISKKFNSNGWDKLGFGICNPKVFHGDIDYYYKVIATLKQKGMDAKIEIYKKNWDTGKLKKIKTVRL